MQTSLLLRFASIAAALLVATATARAQVYKWVDERGVTHYAERPPAAGGARAPTRLDIDVRGGDLPVAAAACSTIRCQYERLRRDRLEREAERREEEESRVSAVAAPTAVPTPVSPTYGTGWIDPGYPIYRRPLVVRPLPAPPPSAAPAGGSRTPAGVGVR